MAFQRPLNTVFPFAKIESGESNVYVAVFYRGNLLLVLLVNAGKVLCFIRWYPFPPVLLQSAFGDKL